MPEPVYDEAEVPEVPVGEDDLPPSELLRDLRWSYRNFGVRCRGTAQQMAMRQMLADDRPRFVQALQKEEDRHQVRVKEWLARRPQPAAAVGGPVERDEGLERAVEMCERWLADYAEREGAGDGPR